MKTTIKVEKEVEIKTLEVQANIRYWEDSEINGVDDEMGDLMPFRKGDLWCPIIDVDSGIIKDWPKGTIANVHYKVCDEGSYYLKNEYGETILKIEEDYVPKMLCPKENGYGDYIIMDIDADGQIMNWHPSFSGFPNDNDDDD